MVLDLGLLRTKTSDLSYELGKRIIILTPKFILRSRKDNKASHVQLQGSLLRGRSHPGLCQHCSNRLSKHGASWNLKLGQHTRALPGPIKLTIYRAQGIVTWPQSPSQMR